MDREPGIVNENLKASIHSCMTLAISDILCSKGEGEAGRQAGWAVGDRVWRGCDYTA